MKPGSSPITRGSAEAPLVVLLQQHVFGEQPPAVDGAVQQQQQVLGVHRLGEEVGGALLHGAHRLLDGAEGGHDDDGHLRVGLPRRLQHVEAAARGQPQVGQDHQEAAAASRRRAS